RIGQRDRLRAWVLANHVLDPGLHLAVQRDASNERPSVQHGRKDELVITSCQSAQRFETCPSGTIAANTEQGRMRHKGRARQTIPSNARAPSRSLRGDLAGRDAADGVLVLAAHRRRNVLPLRGLCFIRALSPTTPECWLPP